MTAPLMQIQAAENRDAAAWDAFVRQQPGWTHFHLFGWRRVIQEVFGHECIYLTGTRATGELGAVLPLVRVRSLLFGDYLVSMPFLNYGGPLGADADVADLARRAMHIAAEEDVDLLELRCRNELALPLDVSHRRITVVLDLPPEGKDALFKRLDPKVRSQVRRPMKEGVTMRFGADQVEPFFKVFSRHMRDLGTPTLPLHFFDAIRREFPDSAIFGVAYLGDQPVAAGCGFVWENEFEMTWASALKEYNRIAPNMMLYWSFMAEAMDRGMQTFNFGRCAPGGGTHRFKSQWGSRDEKLWWYQKSRSSQAATPSPRDGAYAIGPRIWRHLPESIATAVGPRIVRYIP